MTRGDALKRLACCRAAQPGMQVIVASDVVDALLSEPEVIQPFKPRRCTCGHTTGEHHSGGTGWPHPPSYGYCYVQGCDCRAFRDADIDRDAA